MAASAVERVVTATAGRDRVLDAVKATALLAVVVGHSLAWHIAPDGAPINVLDVTPGLTVLTWLFQVLPLFFAAGAVSNAASLDRMSVRRFTARRTRRLGTPVLVYGGVWTLLLVTAALALLALGTDDETLVGAGRFLSQLLWFAGVYTIVVAAAPLTARWRRRPVLTLGAWAILVMAIDVLRIADGPEILGWLNFVLVWAWLHQLGYELPRLRRARRGLVAAAGAALVALAVAAALLGPYSSSLVTVSGGEELSNLAPPSIVLLLYGAGQVCLLAALWPTLAAILSADRLWTIVAVFGARAMGVYLWHIPLVGLAAAVAMAVNWQVQPLAPQWWFVHLAVVVVVVPGAWLLAGLASRPERRLARMPRSFALNPTVAAVGVGATVLVISVTGFATLWGSGLFGAPSSALLNLVLLWVFWQSVGARRADSVDAV